MKRKKLITCVFTAGRSDYFLLKPLLIKINSRSEFSLKLVAGGMHFRSEFGNTGRLIINDGFHIDYSLKTQINVDSNEGALLSMSEDLDQYSKILPKLKPDICFILGDRYEVLAFAVACHILRIPICHIHGGELSYGSFDDANRHAITKLSQLHFPAAEEYRNRIIQMGESPNKVFNVGALAVENIYNNKGISIAEISKKLKINLRDNFFLVTVHPETYRLENDVKNISVLAEALSNFPQFDVIWTISNSDPNGHKINLMLSKMKQFYLINNLGDMYIQVMKKSTAVIGNSSSGIIEAPIVGVSTINIGNRQDGRIRSKSILDTEWSVQNISNAIKNISLNKNFIEKSKLYGFGKTSEKILTAVLENNSFFEEKFYDINLSNLNTL